MADTDARIAFTTTGSRDRAEHIAQALVERRLAACVNIVPSLTSIYRWQGEIHTEHEFLMIIKTAVEKLAALEASLRELHSYQLPEFVVLAVESGSHPYLEWLLQSVRQ